MNPIKYELFVEFLQRAFVSLDDIKNSEIFKTRKRQGAFSWLDGMENSEVLK